LLSLTLLPPGYEDQAYCPAGSCLRHVDARGIVGALSLQYKCDEASSGGNNSSFTAVWTGYRSNRVVPDGWTLVYNDSHPVRSSSCIPRAPSPSPPPTPVPLVASDGALVSDVGNMLPAASTGFGAAAFAASALAFAVIALGVVLLHRRLDPSTLDGAASTRHVKPAANLDVSDGPISGYARLAAF